MFIPEWRNSLPTKYGKLSQDVIYQKGALIEQWSISFNDPVSGERAIIKVRKSEVFSEIIEFEVELAPVPIKDGNSKDITVNWKLYNGFNANKTFWTDSNGLNMINRKVVEYQRTDMTISGNYYPVTSAIAMRDHQSGSNTQVTILNDRTQGGSADVSEPNTIELMQHRRLLADD